VVVSGFQQGHAGQVGPAERTGAIKIGDVLISVNNYFFTNIELNQAVELINSSERPLTLRFSRIDSGSIADVNRIAEGWILAKEPGE
jgi:C-terminal processing protease CtpA/Prc